jgi:hypothetical protein
MSESAAQLLSVVGGVELILLGAMGAPKRPTSVLTHGTTEDAEEISTGHLDVEGARQAQVERVRSGFEGVVAFAAIAGDLLVAEGYETSSRTGVSSTRPLKRTFTGKLKAAERATIGDEGLLAARIREQT